MKTIDTFLKVVGIITVFFLLLVFFNRAKSQDVKLHIPDADKYEWSGGKWIGWGVLAVAGFADGVIEGYQFDNRKSFERKYGIDPVSWAGSESWKLAYKNNNPDDGFKSKWREWIGAGDFYHFADDVRKVGYIGGSAIIALSGCNNNKKWWHYAIDFSVGFTISAAAKSAGMKYIRN